jgi:signal transduction histidine kinase
MEPSRTTQDHGRRFASRGERGRDPAVPAQASGPDVRVALLDTDGVIVWVNEGWDESVRSNHADPRRCGPGVSYLAVCDRADDEVARWAGRTIRAAVSGDLPAPARIATPCAMPGSTGWFDMLVSSRRDDEGRCIGASVTFSPTQRPAVPASQGLTFPDGPRLDLDQTLTELTARAQEVLATQGRLRALLRANAVVASELNLRIVLNHIVEAARSLVGAGYAALGVIGDDGNLDEFVHVGMEKGTVEAIGALPRGRGILGFLTDHAEAVRMQALSEHPASVGFPDAHPPMGSFLGVPIRVRGTVFGNLYLTDSEHGEFTSEDEQLVTALADSAGVAIENAKLYEDSERRRRWQAASAEATGQLLSGVGHPVQASILEPALHGAEADFAVLVRVDGDRIATRATIGTAYAADVGLTAERLAEALPDEKPGLLTDESDPAGPRPMMAAPLQGPDSLVLVLGREPGRPRFTRTDLDQLAGFTGQVAIASELEATRVDHEALAVMQEHERIAADLHDHVIQELFATGMGLQNLVRGLDQPEKRDRVLDYVDSIDATIRRIRTTIFQLDAPAEGDGGLKQQLMAIVDDHRPHLGFAAQVEFAGPLDLAVPSDLAADVLATVREAVSNVARHASATSLLVTVALAEGELTVEVVDDGCGIGPSERSSGLTNLRRRAARHHGTFELSTPPGGGTVLRWSVPCPT